MRQFNEESIRFYFCFDNLYGNMSRQSASCAGTSSSCIPHFDFDKLSVRAASARI